MNVFALYTQSHAVLFDEHFRPTLSKDDVLVAKFLDHPGDGVFGSTSWMEAIIKKSEYIYDIISDNPSMTFVYSDVDIQFFTLQSLSKHMDIDVDIACQIDSPSGSFCTGFMLLRGTQLVAELWADIVHRLKTDAKRYNDQQWFNILVRSSKYKGLRIGALPITFFGGGTLTGIEWVPGNVLPVPVGIVMHHANYCVGVSIKKLQLEHVHSVVHAAFASAGRQDRLGNDE